MCARIALSPDCEFLALFVLLVMLAFALFACPLCLQYRFASHSCFIHAFAVAACGMSMWMISCTWRRCQILHWNDTVTHLNDRGGHHFEKSVCF